MKLNFYSSQSFVFLSYLITASLFISSCSHQQVAERPRSSARPTAIPRPTGSQSQGQVANPAVQGTSPSPELNTAADGSKPIVAKTEEFLAPPPAPMNTQPQPQQNFSFVPQKVETEQEKVFSTEKFPVNSKKIGIILPLTGRNSNLATSVLDAIRMGLGIVPGQPSDFSLAIFDSQGSAEIAASGVEKLLREDNVIAILGGFLSREAQAIAERAEFYRVPFIAFSQKSDLTLDRSFTFRNSITAEMQVHRLVEYAYTVLGARRFGLLYPNDAYGVEFANQYWEHVLARQGTIAAAQIYDPKETDLSAPVQKLVGTFHVDARKEEFILRKKEIADKARKKKETQADRVKKSFRENETKENILPPVINFDVLFLPDSSLALGQTLAFMKSSDVTELTILGTNLWNSPELGRRVGLSQSKILFVDSFNEPESVTNSVFHQKFLAEKQVPPTLLDAQTFEVSSILKDLLSSSNMGRELLADRLGSLGRRPGAYSDLVMGPSHELERPLSILTLDQTIPTAPIKKID